MITAVVTEEIERGSLCRLETGSLRLRRVREGEAPTLMAVVDLKAGEEVSLLPLDPAKLVANGTRVMDATRISP